MICFKTIQTKTKKPKEGGVILSIHCTVFVHEMASDVQMLYICFFALVAINVIVVYNTIATNFDPKILISLIDVVQIK